MALIAASKPGQGAAASDLPSWAYPVGSTGGQVGGDAPLHVPNSTAAYTKTQIADLYAAPDWFPDSHPKMPPIVATGRKPDVAACAYCHLPNGMGRPDSESTAGLSVDYLMEQLSDFKSGARHSSEPGMAPVNQMIGYAKAMTPEEMQAAAAYFASLKPTKWIRVVEADQVPVTHVAGGILVKAEPAAMEPIGERVIEVPEDAAQAELRNPTSGFVAYVPTGSLKTGEAIVKTGGGKTMACIACHGPDLKGMAAIPSIAGRSPSQLARQLADFKSGARNGAGAAMMKPVVGTLTNADIVAVTAYLATLEP